MHTLTTSIGLGLFSAALFLAPGCGQDDALDLSNVAEAIDDDKADVIIPGRSYTWVRPSHTDIRCFRAPCPNAILDDVNLGKSELSYAYDWRALRLSAAEQARLEANASKSLFYGKYATAKMLGESVQIYQVTRVNPRVSEQSIDSPDSDRYYMVKLTDPACQQPPCGYSALLMNQPVKETWTDIDLSRLGLPANAKQILIGELQKGSAYLSTLGGQAMPVIATEAFRPYNAAPLPQN